MASKRKQKVRNVAKLSIKKPGHMLPEERRDIAAWLEECASDLLRYGSRYTNGRFTRGFNYVG